MENEAITQMVKDKYAAIAKSKSSCCDDSCCGADDVSNLMGDAYDQVKGYEKEADLGLGCGLPTETAFIRPGDTVVDLGSGAGNDVFIAARLTGPSGKVIGVDMTEEMITLARENAAKLGYTNTSFELGYLDKNPLASNIADIVVSNCVFNLVPDKAGAFRETFRILRPGGHFSISDIVMEGSMPENLLAHALLYSGCVSGAVPRHNYLANIQAAGFEHVQILREKPIDIPDQWLKEHLTSDEYRQYRDANFSLYSVTVFGKKPA